MEEPSPFGKRVRGKGEKETMNLTSKGEGLLLRKDQSVLKRMRMAGGSTSSGTSEKGTKKIQKKHILFQG